MQHSARNDVAVAGARVVKVHGGPEGTARATTAAAALAHAAAHDLPVPELLGRDGARVATTAITGAVSGARLLATSPATVLHAVGSIARRLHALEPPAGWAVPCDGPAAWVHGDLCPANLLFGPDHVLRAVVDWEDSHVGDPLVDTAWTEWLVRTWHLDAVHALPVLYAPYGRPTPSAAARRAAMRACLERHRSRQDQAIDWATHLDALDGLDLDL